MRMRLMNEFVI